MTKLYHGYYIQGLKEIVPKKSGHSESCIYATSTLPFALQTQIAPSPKPLTRILSPRLFPHSGEVSGAIVPSVL